MSPSRQFRAIKQQKMQHHENTPIGKFLNTKLALKAYL
jgi:hypothetical protein